MNFTSAFRKLGYTVTAHRTDWSADKPDGVCITIWQKETVSVDGRPFMDTRIHCDPLEVWAQKPGNAKRIRHLQRAINEFDGIVDAVIIGGTPGEGFGDAEPWLPRDRRGARWRVSNLDPATGHFEAGVVISGKSQGGR